MQHMRKEGGTWTKRSRRGKQGEEKQLECGVRVNKEFVFLEETSRGAKMWALT